MRLKHVLPAVFWAITPVVSAQAPINPGGNQLPVNPLGQTFNFWTILGNIIDYLAGAIAAVAIAMFVIGALFVTLSGIKEDWRQKGKDLMMGSVMSLAVVLGAYALLRMIEYFLTT
jgi:hypothetical protein